MCRFHWKDTVMVKDSSKLLHSCFGLHVTSWRLSVFRAASFSFAHFKFWTVTVSPGMGTATQPPSFFPTTALVRSPSISFSSTNQSFLGSCSGWPRCGCRHNIVHEPSRSPQSQASGGNSKPLDLSWETHVDITKRDTAKSGMARTLSWLDTQYRRQCLELGPLLSFVSILLGSWLWGTAFDLQFLVFLVIIC